MTTGVNTAEEFVIELIQPVRLRGKFAGEWVVIGWTCCPEMAINPTAHRAPTQEGALREVLNDMRYLTPTRINPNILPEIELTLRQAHEYAKALENVVPKFAFKK